eukprot:14005215-Alexandrium_andersonii.AAC.1
MAGVEQCWAGSALLGAFHFVECICFAGCVFRCRLPEAGDDQHILSGDEVMSEVSMATHTTDRSAKGTAHRARGSKKLRWRPVQRP